MTDTATTQTKLCLQTFTAVAATHSKLSHDAHWVGNRFRRVGSYLQLLNRDHQERFDSFEFSRFALCLSPRQIKPGETLSDRLRNCSFDVDGYLADFKRWLQTEPDGQVLDQEGLSLFLQTARLGRRTFQAAGFDPDGFVPLAYTNQATICTMALGGFKLASLHERTSRPQQPETLVSAARPGAESQLATL